MRAQQGRGASSARSTQLQFKSIRTKPGFILAQQRKKKEMQPREKKKVDRSEFESKLISGRITAKGFLQNRQMGKARKKDWDSDIPYM